MKVIRQIWKNVVGSLLVTSMTVTFGLGSALDALAKAKSVASAPRMNRAATLKMMLESVHTTAQVSWLVSASASSGEEAKRIIEDVTRKAGDAKFPKLSHANNEITADGKSTGIWVDPNGPMRVRYQGRTWKPEATASTEQNYHSFVNFLVPGEKTSLLDWLVPAARADETGRQRAQLIGGVGGLGVSALAAVLATVVAGLAGPEIVVSMLGLVFLAAGVNALAGSMVGATMYDRKQMREALKKLVSADSISVDCKENQAFVTAHYKDGTQVKIAFSQEALSGKHEYARIVSPSVSEEGAVTYLGNKDAVYQQMLQCRSDADAQAMTAQLNDAIAKARVAVGDHRAAETVTTDPVGTSSPATGGKADPAK